MSGKEMFTDILEKGEKIIKVYKPNKKRFYLGVNLAMLLTTVFCVAWIPLLYLDSEIPRRVIHTIFLIAAIAVPIIWVITILFARLYYKNRWYAYTNRRILIRGGIIGIDFKSLQLGDLNATKVYVSWIDKIFMQSRTGTIRFGSPSAPLVETANGASNPYAFGHIEKPYDIMRDIREYIDTSVNKK